MNTIQTHWFNGDRNGDALQLTKTDGYFGHDGLVVYEVHYLAHRGGDDGYDCCNSDQYLSKSEALAAFEARIKADDPFQAVNTSDIMSVIDQFERQFLERGTLFSFGETLPEDWNDRYVAILGRMFDPHSGYYDGEHIHKKMLELKTGSKNDSNGQSEEMLEIPAWKLREMLIAMTELSRRLDRERTMNKQAAA
jgi:hypothetical protein